MIICLYICFLTASKPALQLTTTNCQRLAFHHLKSLRSYTFASDLVLQQIQKKIRCIIGCHSTKVSYSWQQNQTNNQVLDWLRASGATVCSVIIKREVSNACNRATLYFQPNLVRHVHDKTPPGNTELKTNTSILHKNVMQYFRQ